MTGDGALFPALVVGVGHMGLGVMRQLAQEIRTRHGDEATPHVRTLYIDTDPDGLTAATQGKAESALAPQETLLTRLHRPTHYLKPREGLPKVESWLNTHALPHPAHPIPTGMRPLGRLAFLDNYRGIKRGWKTSRSPAPTPTPWPRRARETGLELRTTVRASTSSPVWRGARAAACSSTWPTPSATCCGSWATPAWR